MRRLRIIRAASLVAPITLLLSTSAPGDTLAFEAGGTHGTVTDTWITSDEPDTPKGPDPRVGWVQDDGDHSVALVRFDDLFGETPGQIGPSDQVTGAALEYYVIDAGNHAVLHEVRAGWNEDVTWNTFGTEPGVQPDELDATIGAASGVIGWQSIDVTRSLVRWAEDPSKNAGWALMPDDGNRVELWSVDGPTEWRMVLRVVVNEGPAPATRITRGPYLQLLTPGSAVIRWRTDVPVATRIDSGRAGGPLTPAVTTTTTTMPSTEHEFRLTDLDPNTCYEYVVRLSDDLRATGPASHRFTTPPPPGRAREARIWVIGDSGTANANAAAVYQAYRGVTGDGGTDLWLTLGDNAYTSGTDVQFQVAFFDMYRELLATTCVWPSFGNHDAGSADSGTQTGPYYDSFSLPRAAECGGLASDTEAYYSLDHGNIHLICLDSADTHTGNEHPMMQWLSLDLAHTDAQWIIAYWHHPPYSKGSHDSDTSGLETNMRERALPILEAGGVDLVLAGHSHSYERSMLIDGHYGPSWTLEPEMVLDGGDGCVDGDGVYRKQSGPNGGTVYIVAGTSGSTAGGTIDHPVMVRSMLELGSLVLEVNGNRLDAAFVLADGVIKDRFTLVEDEYDECRCGDLNDDRLVDASDVVILISTWHAHGDGLAADLDHDGVVGQGDLLRLLDNWGACP